MNDERIVGDEPAEPNQANMNAPFARGSTSLRLYPHSELEANRMTSELCAQAKIALAGRSMA